MSTFNTPNSIPSNSHKNSIKGNQSNNKSKKQYNNLKTKKTTNISQERQTNNIRLKKFNDLIFKFDDNNKTKRLSNGKAKIDELYKKSKIRNLYIENLSNQKKEEKLKQEVEQCTFAPKINKKSKLIFNSSKLNNSNDIYKRNISWDKQRNEKIQEDKMKILKKEKEFSYTPNCTKFDRERVFSQNKTVKKNISELIFIKRQENARKLRQYSNDKYNNILKNKYLPLSNEISRLSERELANKGMTFYKKALHNELLFENVED